MSRVFAYCRVSTGDQTTTNQVQEIAAAGCQWSSASAHNAPSLRPSRAA
jgi:DNA invertase Pin-like site-specific DNA recombinase